jgi:hypothetical protein
MITTPGVKAGAVDVGAVDPQFRGRGGAEQAAERLGFPAHGRS